MVTGNRFFFALTAIVLTVAAFFYLFPNEKKQIKKQLDHVCEYASRQQDEPTLTALTKSARIGALFTDTCTLKIRNPGVEGRFSRKEIIDRITLARNSFTRFNVSFYDIDIQFPAKTEAEVVLTMRLLGKVGNEDFADVREVKLTMQKQERDWLIGGVEFIEVLEK